MVPTYVQSGMDLGQPEFDPIYAEAQELGVPIGFHATAQVSQGNWRFHKYLGVHMTSHPFRADADDRGDYFQWRARPLSETESRLSRSRRRLAALLDGALR